MSLFPRDLINIIKQNFCGSCFLRRHGEIAVQFPREVREYHKLSYMKNEENQMKNNWDIEGTSIIRKSDDISR